MTGFAGMQFGITTDAPALAENYLNTKYEEPRVSKLAAFCF